MALRFTDRVAESIAAPSGSAAFVLSATAQWQTSVSGLAGGYQTFANIPSLANNDTVLYSAYDGSGNTEIGMGTWVSASHSLTRTQILSSSNANAACNFTGTVLVFNVVPAEFFMPAIVAAAGTTQGTATILNAKTNLVTSGTGGVVVNILQTTKIVNRAGVTINVYPNSGAAIDALGTNAAATLLNGNSATLEPASATQWYSTA